MPPSQERHDYCAVDLRQVVFVGRILSPALRRRTPVRKTVLPYPLARYKGLWQRPIPTFWLLLMVRCTLIHAVRFQGFRFAAELSTLIVA